MSGAGRPPPPGRAPGTGGPEEYLEIFSKKVHMNVISKTHHHRLVGWELKVQVASLLEEVERRVTAIKKCLYH